MGAHARVGLAGLVALSAFAASPGAFGQADTPLTCTIARRIAGYGIDCQVTSDYITFRDIDFNGGACPSLRDLYARDGRLTFGAVPPEAGKVFRSGDQFSLTVKFSYCPDLTEITMRIDSAAYSWKLR